MKHSEQINSLLKEEKYTEALTLLEKQLEAGAPDEAATLATMAHCHYRLANFSNAVAFLDKAITTAPNKAQLYSERGVAFFMMGNRSASLQDFEKAQEMEPHNPYRYSSRAYVKDAFGDTKGAIADYQKALELDPEDAISYNNLGLLLEKVGYQKEAQQYFAKADQLEGRTPQQGPQKVANSGTTKAPDLTAAKQAPQQKQPLTARYVGNTIKSIFTTRKGFQEFLQYWLGRKREQ